MPTDIPRYCANALIDSTERAWGGARNSESYNLMADIFSSNVFDISIK